ncbi:MAG: CDP-alcohol phosphatidyltransferase family protein [Candidatus Omnitrophica bacterium]|nr:CDP-alcohol phosphatidyltransferase family protein [Candidatus Omnitrophota bacterium]
MSIANKVSTFRLLSVPFFIASLLYYSPQRDWLRKVALGIFLLAVISDAVDGFLARKTKQNSCAGLILDPLADKILLMSAFICLYFIKSFPKGISFPLWVSLIVVSRDAIILLGALLILLIKQNIKFYPTRWGKLTTTFQMLSVMGVLSQWRISSLLWSLAVIFTLISGANYIMQGFKILYEPGNS